jgi:hypothetical protein
MARPYHNRPVGVIDDDQITDVLVRKQNLSGNLKVENMTPTLAEGFSRANEFLHIVLT